jgi:hypothetical protein
MVAARRRDQQRLGDRVPALRVPFQQQVANQFGAGRPARLAGANRTDAGTRQRVDEEAGLRRLAGPLAAFEGDEAPAAGQLRPPKTR